MSAAEPGLAPAAPLQYPVAAGPWVTRVLEAAGEGTPVVLLHGAGARADRWRSSLPVLAARGRRALALDLPGHGFATKGPDVDCSVAGFARAVGAALDALSVRAAALVGTSLGAHVAARLSLDRPDLATRLVLVGPTGLLPLGPDMRAAIAANLRDASLEGIRRKLARVVAEGSAVDEGWVTEEWRVNTSPGAAASFEALAAYVDARLDEDEVATGLRARSGGVPLMVVWGRDDVVVPVGSPEEVARAVGRAEVAYVPGAGHMPYAENTDAFWAEVLPFLEAGGGTGAG